MGWCWADVPCKPKGWDLAASHTSLSIKHLLCWSSMIFHMLTVPKVIFNSRMCLQWLDSTLAWRLPPPTSGRPEWKNGEGWLLIGPSAPPTATPPHTHPHAHTLSLTLAKGFVNQAGLSSYTWANIDFLLAGHLSGAAAAPPPGQICPLAHNKRAAQMLLYPHLYLHYHRVFTFYLSSWVKNCSILQKTIDNMLSSVFQVKFNKWPHWLN